jgi:uncharacterized protein YecT (DUF1311 family)
MKIFMGLLSTVLLSGAWMNATAASFDCAKAQRPFEKAICSDVTLSAADSTMAAAYAEDRSRVSTRMVGEVRVDQLQWLTWVQTVCGVGDEKRPQPEAVKCMQPLYDARVKQLRSLVVPLGGLNFVTRTQFLAAPAVDGDKSLGVPAFPGFGTVQASWPEADTEEDAWAAWNQGVAKDVKTIAAGTNREGSRASDDWDKIVTDEADITAWARLKTVEHGRVTTGINLEGMMHGGAHPYEAWETVTWLLNEARPLQRGDLFVEGSPWRRTLATACWQQLQRWSGKSALYASVAGPEAPVLQQVVSDPRNWTLEQDGLHITYPEYTVAPRFASPEDAIVPWDTLKPLMVAGFVLP